MKKHIRNSSDILSIYPWPKAWQWVMTRTLTRPPNPVFSFKTCCVCSLGQFVRVWSLNNHRDGWHYGHEGTPTVEEATRQDIRIQPGLQRQLLLGTKMMNNSKFVLMIYCQPMLDYVKTKNRQGIFFTKPEEKIHLPDGAELVMRSPDQRFYKSFVIFLN